ncbi:MAG: WYL domain-containing protein [Myxococcales bacterium]|nr:WYL domain-containing protein [Myxococcales bacterium]
MLKTKRQLALWQVLRSHRDGIGLRVLADQLGVSKNTVQRDIDQLSLAGVPIVEEQHGQVFAFAIRDGVPVPVNLTRRDVDALGAASQALRPYRRSPMFRNFEAALAKLESQLGPSNRPVFETRATSGRPAPADSVYDVLLEGILSNRRCEIVYRRRGAKAAKRHVVEPYTFMLVDGLTYLRGRSAPEGQPLTFAAHLISSARLLDERFSRRKMTRTGFGVFDGKPEKVEVRFHPDIAPFIVEKTWHTTQKLSVDTDGWLVFRARLSGMHEFVGWVMSWGDRGQILRPESWATEVVRRARGILQASPVRGGRSR